MTLDLVYPGLVHPVVTEEIILSCAENLVECLLKKFFKYFT